MVPKLRVSLDAPWKLVSLEKKRLTKRLKIDTERRNLAQSRYMDTNPDHQYRSLLKFMLLEYICAKLHRKLQLDR